jgi:large subunit ribosomal protein L25
MPEFVVPAESRAESGKNENRRLRSRGMIPGVLYGAGRKPTPVAVSPREIGAILKSASGENTLFDLELGGSRRKVILKECQREPLRGAILHADFYEVALDKPIEVSVHVELVGTPVGVKVEGGIVDFVTRELEIECLPTDIPEKITVDISHLELGKHLRVSELKLGDKLTILAEPDVVIAHVVLPRAEVAAEAEPTAEAAPAEAGAAEPEVIRKGKPVEEGEAPAEKAEKKAPVERKAPAERKEREKK